MVPHGHPGLERVERAEEKVLKGEQLGEEELLLLADLGRGSAATEEIRALAAAAHRVRRHFMGLGVELEGIVSYKTGGCPEDCHFCSQSARHSAPVPATGFLPDEEVVKAARRVAETGATEFCIVLAVRGPSPAVMRRLSRLVPRIREEVGINVAVSAGILTPEQARQMREMGVHRYNHNLESARSFFPNIVTTHSWEERYETCRLVKREGMELCCGLIFGMGETEAQRVEALAQVRSLEPEEVPLNFLNPRPGTPLATRRPMEAWEAIKWIAISRMAMPRTILRYAGGREITLRELQELGMEAGVNALILGNYLTTLGRSAADDLQMLARLRMPIQRLSSVL
jgi:biotin synthase